MSCIILMMSVSVYHDYYYNNHDISSSSSYYVSAKQPFVSKSASYHISKSSSVGTKTGISNKGTKDHHHHHVEELMSAPTAIANVLADLCPHGMLPIGMFIINYVLFLYSFLFSLCNVIDI